MIVKSYAKINLALDIIGRDNNLYHQLNTIMCMLESYYDVLEIKKSNTLDIKITGKQIFKGANILEKVAFFFKKEFNKDTNFEVNITKNIKVGGGMGGGSSNAASFLHFLLKENNIFLNQNAFCKLALKIGADVPFFYTNKPKICTGYGENISDIAFSLPKNLFAIIYIPNSTVHTKEAFKKLESTYFKPKSKFDNFESVLKSKNIFETIMNKEIAHAIKCLNTLKGFIKVV